MKAGATETVDKRLLYEAGVACPTGESLFIFPSCETSLLRSPQFLNTHTSALNTRTSNLRREQQAIPLDIKLTMKYFFKPKAPRAVEQKIPCCMVSRVSIVEREATRWYDLKHFKTLPHVCPRHARCRLSDHPGNVENPAYLNDHVFQL